jgi:uncharacterized protein (DUF885 family)
MRLLSVLPIVLFAPLLALAGNEADLQAHSLFESDWQWRMQRQPEYATSVGDDRYNASLSDTTLAASRAELLVQRKMLDQARLIDRARLSAQNALSLDVFLHEKELLLREAAFAPFLTQPISNQQGIHVSLLQTVAHMPFATEADYRNYLARLDALPAHITGLIEQLREGMRTGWVAPRVAVHKVPNMLKVLRETAVGGALGQPFRQIPATIDKPVRDALAIDGPAVLRARVMPALLQLEQFMRSDYLPAARESIGAGALPGGQEYYAFLAAQYSGGVATPAELHALGLKEVARIQSLMPAVIRRTGFKGSFAKFAAFASTDARLFPTEASTLLARYRRLIVRAKAGLPRLFANLPEQELLVKPAPLQGAEEMGAAWYEAGVGELPAAFVVNTALLNTRPLWEMETLALHEALPGHHLQVARARELADLPPFRRLAFNVAFGEGWALYAETLGPELGFYKDPFSAFGHLNADLFRSVRLVVDTGIHAQGWTRQQAIDYMNNNSANPAADNEREVDRYIAWPGQALAYKAGQLKILALRARAQAALGARFDVRRFHAAVLDNGPLPLPLLEQQVALWLAAALPVKTAVPPPP